MGPSVLRKIIFQSLYKVKTHLPILCSVWGVRAAPPCCPCGGHRTPLGRARAPSWPRSRCSPPRPPPCHPGPCVQRTGAGGRGPAASPPSHINTEQLIVRTNVLNHRPPPGPGAGLRSGRGPALPLAGGPHSGPLSPAIGWWFPPWPRKCGIAARFHWLY